MTSDVNGVLSTTTVTAVANAAGANSQIQFNNAGLFGATSTFVWDNTNGRLGIGTSSPSSVFAINSRRPAVTMRDNFTGQAYQMRIGGNSLGGTEFDIFNQTSNTVPLYIDSANNVAFGTSTIPAGARMFVYGGTNGANVDVRGTSVVGQDQAVIELEGSDYDTIPNSVKLQYYGPNGLGTTAGFNNQRLGVLAFGGASTSLIGTQDASPLIFFTNNAERLRIGATGNLMIGTTTDTERLSVAGNLRFSGALMPNGFAGATGTVLVSQGAGLAPLWQPLASSTTNSLTFATTTGILSSNINNVVSTTTLSLSAIPGLVSLTSQINGVLPVANGGTGTTTLSTTVVPEGLNLYFTGSRVLSSVLTGFSAASGTVNSTDSVFQAFQKLQGANTALDASLANRLITATGTLGQINRTGDSLNPVFSLANSGVVAGTYGSGTSIPVLTVDAFGRITLAATTSVTGGTGITSLNTLITSAQTFATGISGTDFNIISSGSTHTFSIPNASDTARGLVSTTTQIFAGIKTFNSAPIISTGLSSTSALFTFGNTLTDYQLFSGQANPETQITGSIGDIFTDTINGRLYLKQSGSVTNTGWQQILSAATTSPFASGTVLFADTNGNIAGDISAFAWDNVNKGLKIGGGTLLTGSPFNVSGSVNSYLQANIQNRSSGTSASSDWVATADTGNDTINYVNMGINSSAYADPAFTITGALDSYLYSNGGHLAIGAQTANKSIKFFTGGTLAANERMVIDTNGRVGIGTTTPAATLGIAGNIFVSSTATSTFQGNGINLSNGGCFAVNGVCVGGASATSSLQATYNSGSTIETAAGTPVVITETTAAVGTQDLLQLTANPATGGTYSGDALQITMDAADANANTGNGLTIIVDQSQITGKPILIEDDAGVDLFAVAENGGLTVGSGQSRADVTLFGDLIKKGLVASTTLANINSIFIYDTTKDSDSGAWTNNFMAAGKSWYTESKDDAIGDPCIVATDDRCGTSEFPKKAVIVSTNDSVYIFDAIRNTMWIKFTQSGGTFALGADTNNNPSGVFALNGVVYVGTNGASGTGMYAFDFFQDRLLNYDSVDRTQGDNNIANRNTAVSYATNAITALSIFSNVVNDVHGTVIAGSSITLANGGPLNGGVFIGAATDDAASIINVSSGKVLRYAATTNDINQIWITKRGRLYLANETLLQIERYNDIEVATVNDATPDKIFDEQAANLPNAFQTVPTFATTPDALWVTERSSFAQSTIDTTFADTIYYGHSGGLSEIHDVIAPSATVIGWSKFYNTGSTTPYMSGTPRGMFSFSETTGDLTDSTIRNSVLEPEVAPTYGVNGVYGTGLSFNGSSQFLCSDANNDGTCDTDADFNVGLISFHVELWFRHPTAVAGTDVLVDRRYTAFSGAEGVGYTIEMNATGNIVFGIQDTAATATYDDSVTSTQAFNDNEWHHLVAVNTDTAICLYIDGKLAVACDTTLAATLTLDASQILFIGADGSGAAGGNFWTGEIDDVYFAGGGATVSDSLTQAQVQRKYIAGRQVLTRSSAIATDAETFTSTTIGDSAATWILNEFAGSLVEITSGTGVGQTRRITSNTATIFTVSPAFSVTPDATSDFKVMPEQLYGGTNNVTSVSVTDTNVLSKMQAMYVGSSDSSDAGGVTAFQGYGTGYVTDVYHSDAAKTSDTGTAWSGTDADDVTAIGAINGTVAIGSLQHFWLEKVDQYLEQSIDQISNNIAQMQMELLQDGLLGTSPQSGFLGGADLAEYYTSLAHLDPGTIVSIDTSYPDAVKSSSRAYQKDVIGIVATRPGIILGGQTETTYPIALVGRVPVNVTTENGIIKAGDRITPSTLAGYGMRATKAGRVVGVAIEDMDPEKFTTCLGDPEGVTKRLCGQVMVFVNLVDYSGISVSLLMNEAEAGLTFDSAENIEISTTTCTNIEGFATSTNPTGLCDEGFTLTTSTTTVPTTENSIVGTISPRIFDRENKIIEYLKSIRPETGNIGLDSEILTDRLSAAFEVFTPQVITEGLRVDYISALFESVVFKSDVIFFGTPYFTTDTAGFAVVKAGDTQVDVIFEKEYLEKPIVNASMATSDGLQVAGVQTAMIQAIFGKDIRFLIANASTTGFTIFLNKAVDEDVEFNWIALAVKGAKKHESKTATTTVVDNHENAVEVENNSPATTTQEEFAENPDTIVEENVTTETIPENLSQEVVSNVEAPSNQNLEQNESLQILLPHQSQ